MCSLHKLFAHNRPHSRMELSIGGNKELLKRIAVIYAISQYPFVQSIVDVGGNFFQFRRLCEWKCKQVSLRIDNYIVHLMRLYFRFCWVEHVNYLDQTWNVAKIMPTHAVLLRSSAGMEPRLLRGRVLTAKLRRRILVEERSTFA